MVAGQKLRESRCRGNVKSLADKMDAFGVPTRTQKKCRERSFSVLLNDGCGKYSNASLWISGRDYRQSGKSKGGGIAAVGNNSAVLDMLV